MCKDRKQIKFAPLNKTQEYVAEDLMEVYEVSLLFYPFGQSEQVWFPVLDY